MLSANFWQDKNNSQRVIKEKKFYEELINSLNNNVEKLKDLDDLNQLALEEENLQVQNEVLQNIKDLRSEVKKNESNCFLSNEADPLNCYIEIHAGAGGTESQDWADMLRRMYLKWSDKKNFKSNLISEHRGDEAGIKSATIKIDGDYVFGWLKKEYPFKTSSIIFYKSVRLKNIRSNLMPPPYFRFRTFYILIFFLSFFNFIII